MGGEGDFTGPYAVPNLLEFSRNAYDCEYIIINATKQNKGRSLARKSSSFDFPTKL